MSQSVKISDAELSEIKVLQGKFQESVYKFGNLHIEKMELDRLISEFVAKEKSANEEWTSLQKMEQSILDKIVSNYGEGNLNMKDGTFTKTAEQV